VVGGATPVLRRLAAPAALLAVLAAYYVWHSSLPALSTWGDVAFLAFLLIPAVFGLVYFALPFWDAVWWKLLGAGVGLLLAAFALQWAGGGLEGNFAKLAAMAALGFLAAAFVEEVTWLVLIGAAISLVDAYSVWRGPTHEIVNKQPQVFSALSFAFPVPGGNGGVARLGLPDLFFFALFLASCPRFGLRTRLTWLTMTLSFGATIALAVWWNQDGLPALPLLVVGFLAPNADLIWRAFRESRTSGSTP
jgi:hypothetical protein